MHFGGGIWASMFAMCGWRLLHLCVSSFGISRGSPRWKDIPPIPPACSGMPALSSQNTKLGEFREYLQGAAVEQSKQRSTMERLSLTEPSQSSLHLTRVKKHRFLKCFLFRCVLQGRCSHSRRPLKHTHRLDMDVQESSWHCPRETLSVRHPTVFLASPKDNQVFLLLPTEDADVDGGSMIMHSYLV